jgi:hypothetical protein
MNAQNLNVKKFFNQLLSLGYKINYYLLNTSHNLLKVEVDFSPLSKVVKFTVVILCFSAQNLWAYNSSGIDATSGLGYIQWLILAIGLIFTLIMGISCGFAFKHDAANAKAQLIGTIMIPILSAIILYIYNKTLGISLDSNSSL